MAPALVDVVGEILASETGERRSSERIAAGVAKVCEKISGQLSPLIGSAGFQALLSRSLKLATATHPWLASDQAGLRASLERQEAASAIEASSLVLANLIELLTKLVGEGLTRRLLQEVWPEVFPVKVAKEDT